MVALVGAAGWEPADDGRSISSRVQPHVIEVEEKRDKYTR